MKKLLLICASAAISTAAMAHDSVVPHVHPHDVSMLPDLTAMLLAAGVVVGGALVLRKLKGR